MLWNGLFTTIPILFGKFICMLKQLHLLSIPSLHCVHWCITSVIDVDWHVHTIHCSSHYPHLWTGFSDLLLTPVQDTRHSCLDSAATPHPLSVTSCLPCATLSPPSAKACYCHLEFHRSQAPGYMVLQSSFTPIGFSDITSIILYIGWKTWF